MILRSYLLKYVIKVDKSMLISFINILLSDKQWCLTAVAKKQKNKKRKQTTERVAHIKAFAKMCSCHLCYTEKH